MLGRPRRWRPTGQGPELSDHSLPIYSHTQLEICQAAREGGKEGGGQGKREGKSWEGGGVKREG